MVIKTNPKLYKEMSLDNNILVDKKSLKKLTKTQLINILLKQAVQTKESFATARSDSGVKKPVPMPRKSVKQMIIEYEENIILPPLEFRDD